MFVHFDTPDYCIIMCKCIEREYIALHISQSKNTVIYRILQLSQSNCKRQCLRFSKLNVDHSVQAGKFKRNLASYCFAAVAIMILFGLVALPCSAFFCFASLFCSTSHELRLTVKIKVSNLEHHQNWKVYQNSIFAMID